MSRNEESCLNKSSSKLRETGMNSSLETVKFIEQSKKSALENEMILPILPMKMEWNTEESCSKVEKHERNKSRKKKPKG